MDVLKSLIVALTLLFAGSPAWAEEASGFCKIGSGNEYVEATAYLTETATNKYSLDVVVGNSASSPLVNIHVTVTADDRNGNSVTLFNGMVYPSQPVPGPGSAKIITNHSVNTNSKLTNLKVSVNNAICQHS